MSVDVTIKKKTYSSTKKNHGEEIMFSTGKYNTGDLAISMNGWPCTGGHNHHNCHDLFIRKSAGRTITITITGDKAGYALNYGRKLGATGTITYTNGVQTIS